jgi:hypothetical protein
VRAGRLGKADLLALQVRHGLQRRVFAHHDRLRGGRRRFLRDEGQLGAGGLREHGHGVGHVGADVEVVEVQCFQQRQAAGELVPAQRGVERRELLLQRALHLQQRDQRGRLLVAEPHRHRPRGGALREDGAGAERTQRGDGRAAGNVDVLHDVPCPHFALRW